MPPTKVVLFRKEDGGVPLLQWLDELSPKASAKCRVRLQRLAAWGYELRRPEADYLGSDIYELRVGLQGINYRMLYFFHGLDTAVISHGLTKLAKVPVEDINKAIDRKHRFAMNPSKHTHLEG